MDRVISDAGLDALAERIEALARPLLLAFDVDGTLAPIVRDPASAAVPPDVASDLARLGDLDQVSVAIVTGRDTAGLERMLSLPSAWRVTEHGRAIRAPGAPPHIPALSPLAQARLDGFKAWARREAQGARIEEKAASVVVHVRDLMTRDPSAGAAILARAKARAEADDLFVREGRAVVEAEADPGDKGRALREVARRAGAATIVYAGDDRTDEPAIAAASERGLGIFVRSAERPDPPPGAAVVVDGPPAIARLLQRLARPHR